MSLFQQARIGQQPPYYSWISPLLQTSLQSFRTLLIESESDDTRFWRLENPYLSLEEGEQQDDAPAIFLYEYHLRSIGSGLSWIGIQTPNLVVQQALGYYKSIQNESFGHSNLQLAFELFLYLQHTVDLLDKNIHPNGLFALSLLHQFQKLNPSHEGELSTEFDVFDPPFYKKAPPYSLLKEPTDSGAPSPTALNQNHHLLGHHNFFIPFLHHYTQHDAAWKNHWKFYTDLPLHKSLKLSLWHLYKHGLDHQELQPIKKFYLLESGNDSWAQNVGMSKEDLGSLCQEIRQHFLNLKDTIDVWALHGIQDLQAKEAFLIQWRQLEQTCELLNLKQLSKNLQKVHDELQKSPTLSAERWEEVATFLTEFDLTLEEQLTDGESTSIRPQQKEAKRTLLALHEGLLEELSALKHQIEEAYDTQKPPTFTNLSQLESGLSLIEHPLHDHLQQSFKTLTEATHINAEVAEAYCWIESAVESLVQHAPHVQEWSPSPVEVDGLEKLNDSNSSAPTTSFTIEPTVFADHHPHPESGISPEVLLDLPKVGLENRLSFELEHLHEDVAITPPELTSVAFISDSPDPSSLKDSTIPDWVSQELGIQIDPNAFNFEDVKAPLLMDADLTHPEAPLHPTLADAHPSPLEPMSSESTSDGIASNETAQDNTVMEWVQPTDAPDIKTIKHTEDLVPTYPKEWPSVSIHEPMSIPLDHCDPVEQAKKLIETTHQELSTIPVMEFDMPVQETGHPSSTPSPLEISPKKAHAILGDPEQDAIILQSFLQELKEMCHLRPHIDAQDWLTVQRCFHTLKGNSMALRHKSGSSLGLIVEKHIKTFMHLGHDQFNIKEQGIWLNEAFDSLEHLRDHYLDTQDDDYWLEPFFAKKPKVEQTQSKLEDFVAETRTAEARMVQSVLQAVTEEQRFSLSYYCQQHYPAGLSTQWSPMLEQSLHDLHSFAKFLSIEPIIELTEGSLYRKKTSLLLVALVDVLLMDEMQEIKVLLSALQINTQALLELAPTPGASSSTKQTKHFKHLADEQIEILQRLKHLSQTSQKDAS